MTLQFAILPSQSTLHCLQQWLECLDDMELPYFEFLPGLVYPLVNIGANVLSVGVWVRRAAEKRRNKSLQSRAVHELLINMSASAPMLC